MDLKKLYKEIINEVATNIYVDTDKTGSKLSIKGPNHKNKQPLNINKLTDFVKNLGSDKSKKPLTNNFHCQFEYSNGNSKLGKDTIIVNMGSATDCPSAKAGLCELYANGLCYANNQERGVHGKNILPAKRRHGIQWNGHDANEISLSLVAIITQLRKKNDIRYVRMNEAGDFTNKDDIEKLRNVVTRVNELLDKPVIFYNYTHRSDLFPMDRNPLNDLPNFILQGSGYRKDMSVKPVNFEAGKLGRKVRPAEMVGNKKVAFMIDNCFYALQYEDFKKAKFGSVEDASAILPHGVTKEQVVQCPGSCLNCDQCKTKGKKFIVIVIHGTGAQAQTNVQQLTRALSKRNTAKTPTSNSLPMEDNEITKLYTSIGRNDYDFIDKLYGYYEKDHISTDDITNIWNRLLFLRSIAKNTKEAQEKDWISPNKVGKSTLKEPLEDYLLTLQKKSKKKTPITESKKFKQIDLNKLNPIQLANLAVTGLLAKFEQFVSPDEFEESVKAVPTTQETTQTTPTSTPMPTTPATPAPTAPVAPTAGEVVADSLRVQRAMRKILGEKKCVVLTKRL